MSEAKPKTWQKRRAQYRAQTGSKIMTPAQTRRDLQKRNAKKS
jgi:hypothetical protein